MLSRQPDSVLNPQFWAEDGHIWFPQAYNLGWLKALFIPYAGYLQTFPRLVAAFVLLFPLHFTPLLMNLWGLTVQVLPVSFLLSSRCDTLASLSTRALWAVVYVFLPNTLEVHINLTNGQWHLALLACLIVLSEPAATRLGRACDTLLLVVAGLTGPFCLFLLCAGSVLYWRKPSRWRRIQLVILLATSLIQILVMLYASPMERAHLLGASLKLLVRLISGQIYLGALLGSNVLADHAPLGFLLVVFCCGSVFPFYTAWKAPLESRLFLMFCLITLAASLVRPVYSISYGKPAWPYLLLFSGCRYWFLPMLAFAWSLVWCARNAASPDFRMAGRVVLTFMILGVIRDYQYPPLRDEHFAIWSDRFEHAKSGTYWEIPAPAGSRWPVRLWKR